MLIYMLEDDQVIRDLVLYALRQQTDLEAQGFERPSAFYAAVRSRVPDLILLDVMLPEEDGLTVLKNLRLRRETKLTPVIILSAKGTGYDKICGLDGGADDYIPKPFEIMELLSRVKAWERRLSLTAQEASGEEQPREYRIGGLTVSPVYHTVTADGEEVRLTMKEYEILCYLLAHQDQVCTREQIFGRLWGYGSERENRTLDVHIRTLRVKLGEYGNLIETIRGVGYKIRSSV